MPVIYIDAPGGAIHVQDRQGLARRLTDSALHHEGLPATPFVRSTCWIFFRDHEQAAVFHGGTTNGTPVITVEVNAFTGGLEDEQKAALIREFTDLISAAARSVKPAVYVLFRDVPAANWGVLGETITLDQLRHPAPEVQPL
ncbi:4-oxalocrotonate tautomerase family protein [Frondihabitans sp. VKM Ac-2883]|uniref:tautomerase family protein n=1 Tax=Frondihabitans sp. VKM Ac-2883 TaxID=2783823 RepID=UPI00188A91A4|nr:4-oxalocrotonate tautomerase family protein [Frondihabitans sp. VKM Ac-2883]MBF4577522.1 4-oxalocrotonate tautomerase family protein [Frondihabitans sp. VKM Ac-2883]